MEHIYSKKELCSGCGACQAVCPKGAITMTEDLRGFAYPVVDQNKCVECGLCVHVCQTQGQQPRAEEFTQQAYLGRNADEAVLDVSQSGGISAALVDTVLAEGGVVYGAAMMDDFSVSHIRVSDPTDAPKLQGSKYVQSNMAGIHRQIREDLRQGKTVLFTGTPCQCDGLRRYVTITKTPADSLYLVDLICHGVPPVKLWLDYLAYLEKKYKGKVDKALFRDKSKGWSSHFEAFWINGEKITEDKFKKIYNTNACLRESCYQCPFSSLNRSGDMTIGDAWMKDRRNQKHKETKGTSLILVNNSRGAALFEKVKVRLDCQPTELEEYLQPNLQHPTTTKENAAAFWREYKKLGMKYIMLIFGGDGRVNKALKILRRYVVNAISKPEK